MKACFFQTRDILKQSMELPSSLKTELSSLTQAPGWEMRHGPHSWTSGQDCSYHCMMPSPSTGTNSREGFAVLLGSQPAPLCRGAFAEEGLDRDREQGWDCASPASAPRAQPCQQSSTSSCQLCCSPSLHPGQAGTAQTTWALAPLGNKHWISTLGSLNPKFSKPFLLPKQLPLTLCQFLN